LRSASAPVSVLPDKQIVRDVLRFFLRNPSITDTLEGIARWRLMEETLNREVEQTRTALQWLLERGLLMEVKVGGSVPHYGINLDRLAEARQLVGYDTPEDLIEIERRG
jgi:hypothetical protein